MSVNSKQAGSIEGLSAGRPELYIYWGASEAFLIPILPWKSSDNGIILRKSRFLLIFCGENALKGHAGRVFGLTTNLKSVNT